jgi:hypothetical protein
LPSWVWGAICPEPLVSDQDGGRSGDEDLLRAAGKIERGIEMAAL